MILVVAAHPDDEVLGCGATIRKRVTEGLDVHIAILGEGVTSRYAKREEADPKLVDHLRRQALKVSRMLGAKSLHTYGLPDNRFDTVPMLDIVKQIEILIRKFRPRVIYTHHGGDLNIDHGIIHRATLAAARPGLASSVREIYSFEVASSTEWSFAQVQPVFRPTVFVDVSATLAVKLKAMAVYDGETRKFPHPRSLDALRISAQKWGSVAGVKAAEAFELIRSVESD